MTKILTAFFLLFTSSAIGAEWSIQVTYPDYEVKNFKLDDMEFKTFLPKTSWRCWASETTFNKKQEIKRLRCNYSSEKTGEISTMVSCGDVKKFGELVIDLKDEKKSLDFKLHLICRVN
ncbi:MAG: hypothetical protein ACJAT2_002991 [Bacteriovoracaceae bacterium]|jgi:hypothetical protein